MRASLSTQGRLLGAPALTSHADASFLAAAATSGESVTVCALSVNDSIVSKLRYVYVSAAVASIFFHAAR